MSDVGDLKFLPPQLFIELAMGLESDLAIFNKYNYSSDDFLRASAQPWYRRAVAEAKAKIEAEGYTFKNKMSAMAEELLVDAWRAARNSTNVDTKLDVAKYISKLAGLEPQANAVAGAAAFNVVINIPSPNGATTPTTITSTAEQIDDHMDLLPVPPAYVLQLPMNNEELSGVGI